MRVQIHRRYTSILNLLRRESIAVSVEDQGKLVFGRYQTPSFPSRSCNQISAPVPPLGRFVSLGLLTGFGSPLAVGASDSKLVKSHNLDSWVTSCREIVSLSLFVRPKFSSVGFMSPAFVPRPQSGHIA